jgi:hypothetical protein
MNVKTIALTNLRGLPPGVSWVGPVPLQAGPQDRVLALDWPALLPPKSHLIRQDGRWREAINEICWGKVAPRVGDLIKAEAEYAHGLDPRVLYGIGAEPDEYQKCPTPLWRVVCASFVHFAGPEYICYSRVEKKYRVGVDLVPIYRVFAVGQFVNVEFFPPVVWDEELNDYVEDRDFAPGAFRPYFKGELLDHHRSLAL